MRRDERAVVCQERENRLLRDAQVLFYQRVDVAVSDRTGERGVVRLIKQLLTRPMGRL